MVWRMMVTGALVLLLALQARTNEKMTDQDTYAVKAGLIYTLSEGTDLPRVIQDGVLIVLKGRVAAIGRDLPIPPDMAILDYRDHVIMPGLVLADTHWVRAVGGFESISAKYHSLDGFDFYANQAPVLAGGVTTAYLNPGRNRLVSGLGAVIKVAGEGAARRVLRAQSDLCVNLGDGAFHPPLLQEYPLPASSTHEIPPGVRQAPNSRLGQYEALRNAFQQARAGQGHDFNYNLECLIQALKGNPSLRMEARRMEDLEGALRLAAELDMPVYLAGAVEAHRVLASLAKAKLPVALEVPVFLNEPAQDRAYNDQALDACLSTAASLADAGIPFALYPREKEGAGALMMAAAAAVRGGLDPMAALEAITLQPARILGVDKRVGSLAPGKDADFLVLSGKPLKVRTHVLKVYSSGREVFAHPAAAHSLVVRAGRIYTATGAVLENGEILIEEGKISAVGLSVPHPPGARIVDAGEKGVVTPGFIDGHGHLGMEGDTTSPGMDICPADAVFAHGDYFRDVARAGITTVVVAPHSITSKGAQLSAIKSAGPDCTGEVVDSLAAVKFSFRKKDPALHVNALGGALKAGKAYADSWLKYYEKLEKWKKDQAAKKGEKAKEETPAKVEVEKKDAPEEKKKADPITGTWDYEVSGGPMPEPQSGQLRLKLDGNMITGSGAIFFTQGQDVSMEGTLEGNHVVLEFDLETRVGKPKVDALIDAEDHMQGTVTLGDYFTLVFSADRTAKEAPKVTVASKKKKKGDGRPEPPKRKGDLEPYRRLMAKEIPALVEVGTAEEIEAVIKLFVDEYKLPLGLLGAEEAYKVADRIREAKVSVVVPARVVSMRKGRPFVLADELARHGISVIFQSNVEDGARSLPMNAGYFVHQGMSAEDALKALTINQARLYKLDDRIGSLERGKDGDLVIFSDDPFEIGSRVLRVFISGNEVCP